MKYIGNLTGPRQERTNACPHLCAQCGRGGQELLFDAVRDHEISIVRGGKEERYEVRGVGGSVINADLAPGSIQVELPPPPPVVWIVYKHGGRYTRDALQGIYSSEEGAMQSVRFAVKEERASLARRLGQPVTPHKDEEPVLTWSPVHWDKYGPIPGWWWTEAGLADFTIEKHSVPEGYLPDTDWCQVPMATEVPIRPSVKWIHGTPAERDAGKGGDA